MGNVKQVTMMSAVTSASTQSITVTTPKEGAGGRKTFQAIMSAVGTSLGTVTVQASNNGVDFVPRGTISVGGTSSTVSGAFVPATPESWVYWRGVVNGIGTSASIDLLMGLEQNG